MLLFLFLLILRAGGFGALEEEARVLCQKVVNSYVACRTKKVVDNVHWLNKSSMELRDGISREDVLTIGFRAVRPFFFA